MNDFPNDAVYTYTWPYISYDRIGSVFLRLSAQEELAANTIIQNEVLSDLRAISIDRMVDDYTDLLVIPEEARRLYREWDTITSVPDALEYLCTRKVTSGPYVQGSGCFLIKHVDEIREVLNTNNISEVTYSEVVKNIPFIMPDANTEVDTVFGIFDITSDTLSCVNSWLSPTANKNDPIDKVRVHGWSSTDRTEDQDLKSYSPEFLNSDFLQFPFGKQYANTAYTTILPNQKYFLNLKVQQDRYLTGDPKNPVYVDPPPTNTVKVSSQFKKFLVQFPSDYKDKGTSSFDTLYNAPNLYDPSLLRNTLKDYRQGRQHLRFRPKIEFLQKTPYPASNIYQNNTFSAPFVVRDEEAFITVISKIPEARLWISTTPGGDQLSRWNVQFDPDIDDYVFDNYVEPDYVIDGNELGYFGTKNIINIVDFSTFNPLKWSRFPFRLERNNVYWINIFGDDNSFLDINQNKPGRYEKDILKWPELDYETIDDRFIIRL